MNTFKIALGSLALTLTFAPAAFAQDAAKTTDHAEHKKPAAPGHGKDGFISENDTNGDGRVSLAEFSTARAAKHRTFDLNGDGKVTEAEYVGEYTTRAGKDGPVPEGQVKQAHVRFGVLDTDKNADLTFAEFNVSGDRMFNRLDTNGDNFVDAADTNASY